MARFFTGAVLNTIQAVAADLVLSGNKLQVNDGSNDIFTEPVPLARTIQSVVTVFTAGTAGVDTVDFAGVSIVDGRIYTLETFAEGIPNPEGSYTTGAIQGVGDSRVYTVGLEDGAATTDLRTAFVTAINNDLDAPVTAAGAGGSTLTLTVDTIANGDVTVVQQPTGSTVAQTTPHVNPAGSPDEVNALFPGQADVTGQYRKYDIVWDRLQRNNGVSGAKVSDERSTIIYADETATNFAAFDTEYDAIIAGTHTPATDYDGI